MGIGDIRSKKGKITARSFGNSRLRKSNAKAAVARTAAKASTAATAETATAEKPKKTGKKTVKAKKK